MKMEIFANISISTHSLNLVIIFDPILTSHQPSYGRVYVMLLFSRPLRQLANTSSVLSAACPTPAAARSAHCLYFPPANFPTTLIAFQPPIHHISTSHIAIFHKNPSLSDDDKLEYLIWLKAWHIHNSGHF